MISPYTPEQIASILECVNVDKIRVEKIVVSAASEYVRSLERPPLKRANPANEIALLDGALQSMLKALSDLSPASKAFLDGARRDPGSLEPSSHDDVTDCAALSNCIHRFLIENKDGLDNPLARGARPGRSKVNDRRRLLERLNIAFAAGSGGEKPSRSRSAFLRLCGAAPSMKLNSNSGANWWDDLDRKKSTAKRQD